jgi:Xaa-Pro aminopeptidase
MSDKVRVIIDSPQKNSSLLYASGFFCIDPFIFIHFNNKRIAWLPSTEFEKAKYNSKLTEIKNLSDEFNKLGDIDKSNLRKSFLVLNWLLKNKINKIHVPEDFPSIELDYFIKNNIIVVIDKEPFYEQRVIKSDIEIDYIRENTKKNEKVMNEVKNILGESKITNNNKLKYNGITLTSEFLQNFILKSFIDKNMVADNAIVACGDQGCFPHEYGTGDLYANTSIIVDIFPKNRSNLYYTDMTRTFCKGKASNELKLLYNTVLEAQKIGLENIKSNVQGTEVHKLIQNFFEEKGFKTGIFNNILQGFFHGTGHGIGLDCHELPYISQNGSTLINNSVVSVEPGLYYLGKGAVRIEDLVIVNENSIENLVTFEKKLEIE